jgi:hypothetical protein
VYVTSVHDQQLLMHAIESSPSQYDVVVTRAGSYQLSVRVDSQHAVGSPSSFKLVAGPPVSAHLECASDYLPAWRVAEPFATRFFFADQYGNNVTRAGKDLSVTVDDPDGERTVHPIHQDQSGYYSLDWTPVAAGVYRLRVPAVGSEFDVPITSSAFDAAQELCTTADEAEESAERSAPVAQSSFANGASLAWARNAQLADFVVVLRDANEQVVCPLESELDVSILIDNCDVCDITPHVFRQRCEYRVFFTPELSVHLGTWQARNDVVTMGIHVRLGQRHIAGSPFVTSVLPALTPLIVEARLDASLESILVRFDAATDRGLQTRVNVDCGQYFPEEMQELGARCEAAWIDARSLVLQLGQDAGITGGRVLTLHSRRVRSSCGTSAHSFGKFVVQAPRDATAPPKISLRGSSLIGKCDSVRLLADSLAMCTALVYEWSVTAVGPVDGHVVGNIASHLASLPQGRPAASS